MGRSIRAKESRKRSTASQRFNERLLAVIQACPGARAALIKNITNAMEDEGFVSNWCDDLSRNRPFTLIGIFFWAR